MKKTDKTFCGLPVYQLAKGKEIALAKDANEAERAAREFIKKYPFLLKVEDFKEFCQISDEKKIEEIEKKLYGFLFEDEEGKVENGEELAAQYIFDNVCSCRLDLEDPVEAFVDWLLVEHPHAYFLEMVNVELRNQNK